jgi:aspartate/methionine/tyrosine aminotransferase
MDSGMFLSLQHAAVEALRLGPDWFNQLNDVYRQRRKKGESLLRLLGCSYEENQSGLFLWARVPAVVENVEAWVDELLYGTHVFITPGMVFGEAGKQHVRISLCATEDRMDEAVERIRKWQAGAGDLHTRERKMDAA